MRDDIFRFLKGFAMGAANVIPGVSGGTIAFITGIYERLIDALKRIDLTTIRMVLKFRLKDAWEPVPYTHLRAHETREALVCRLLLEKKKPLTHYNTRYLVFLCLR